MSPGRTFVIETSFHRRIEWKKVPCSLGEMPHERTLWWAAQHARIEWKKGPRTLGEMPPFLHRSTVLAIMHELVHVPKWNIRFRRDVFREILFSFKDCRRFAAGDLQYCRYKIGQIQILEVVQIMKHLDSTLSIITTFESVLNIVSFLCYSYLSQSIGISKT